MKKSTLLLAALCLLGFSSQSWASGYQVNLQGQKQTAMGNTGTGLALDPSNIFFNPGALAMTEGSGVMMGGNFIFSNVQYVGPEPAQYNYFTDNPTGTPFFVYASYAINDKLKAGVGVFTPFGSTVKWEDGWSGRYALTQLSLKAIYIQPTLSYKINDQLSVGAGLDIAMGSVNLQKDIPLYYQGTDDQGHAELDGKAKTGFGYNLGIYFKPIDKFSVGVNYRSKINVEVEDGTATFTAPDAAAALFPNTTFTASLPMPSVLTVGIGVYPSEKITLAADFSMVGWSAYKDLTFTYAEPVAGSNETVNVRNYKNSFIVKFGGEYKVSDAFAVRAGYYFDQSPVQDGYMTAETPDSNSMGLTCGLGYKVADKLSIDVSFLYINKAKRTNVAAEDANTISGTFKSIAVIPGFAVGYSF